MKTRQINLRLEADLVHAVERVARKESLDRGTVIRRLLEDGVRQWEVEHALDGYRRGELSLGGAAEEAGLTQWELLEAVRKAGIAYPLQPDEVAGRLAAAQDAASEPADERGFRTRLTWLGEEFETLADVPPQPGRVLLVGRNPAPLSVSAGHYYQGRIGKRLWARLERLGLLGNPTPGAEDEAFARAGHGLTDLVKRPTGSARELRRPELEAGARQLRVKIRQWRPSLVLFAFAEPARRLTGELVRPGPGPTVEGVPTFLLSGPYARREETRRIDAELARILDVPESPQGPLVEHQPASSTARSQRITAADLAAGRIRLPRAAKPFFPGVAGRLDVIVRGVRLSARYDPRLAPDRERSAVLFVGRSELSRVVSEGERLRVTRGLGGIPRLD